MNRLVKTVPFALGIAGLFTLSAGVSKFTVGTVLGMSGLEDEGAIVAAYSAELVARLIVTGATYWKLSLVLAEVEDHKDFLQLMREKAVMFALALLATLAMALDNRAFWWWQYLTGQIAVQDIHEATAYRAAFTALVVNCITLVLMNWRSVREFVYGLVALTGVTTLGFIGGTILWANLSAG